MNIDQPNHDIQDVVEPQDNQATQAVGAVDENHQSVNTADGGPILIRKAESHDLKPKITVFGVGGGGGNAVSNMIAAGLEGVKFVAANTDAQALGMNRADHKLQLGRVLTEGLGAGSLSEIGAKAAIEVEDEIRAQLEGSHMVFVTAGMGGGTGTGAAPIIASIAKSMGILTVAVVTKPFGFEGAKRMKIADEGIDALEESVDTLITIPNQNLFRIANEKTTFGASFCLADEVLHKGVACITNLIVKEGLINLDFADVRTVMKDMGKAMMGTGEAEGEGRALKAAEAAIANPLLDEISMQGARGLLVSISGGPDLGLYEVDEAASYIRGQVDPDANVIVGTTLEEALNGIIKVSVVATGLPERAGHQQQAPYIADRAPEVTHSKPYNSAPTSADVGASGASGSLTSSLEQADEVSEDRNVAATSDERASEALIAASLQSDLLGLDREPETVNYESGRDPVTVSAFSPSEAYDLSKYTPAAGDSLTAPSAVDDVSGATPQPYIPPAPLVSGRPMPKTSDFPLSLSKDAALKEGQAGLNEPTVHSMWRKLLPGNVSIAESDDRGSDLTGAALGSEAPSAEKKAPAVDVAIPIPSFLKKQTG